MDDKKYGLITEIGDLGLGFDVLSESDNDKININKNNDNKED